MLTSSSDTPRNFAFPVMGASFSPILWCRKLIIPTTLQRSHWDPTFSSLRSIRSTGTSELHANPIFNFWENSTLHPCTAWLIGYKVLMFPNCHQQLNFHFKMNACPDWRYELIFNFFGMILCYTFKTIPCWKNFYSFEYFYLECIITLVGHFWK